MANKTKVKNKSVGIEKVVKTNKYFFWFLVSFFSLVLAAGSVVLAFMQWPIAEKNIQTIFMDFLTYMMGDLAKIGTNLKTSIMIFSIIITSAILVFGYLVGAFVAIKRKFLQWLLLLFPIALQIAANILFVGFPFYCDHLNEVQQVTTYWTPILYLLIAFTLLYNVGFCFVYSFYVKHLVHIEKLGNAPFTAARKGLKNLYAAKNEGRRQKAFAEKLVQSENRKKANIQRHAKRYVFLKHREEVKLQKALDRKRKHKERALYKYLELKKEVNNTIVRVDRERIAAEKAAYLAHKLAQNAEKNARKAITEEQKRSNLFKSRCEAEQRVIVEKALSEAADNERKIKDEVEQRVATEKARLDGTLDDTIIADNRSAARIRARAEIKKAKLEARLMLTKTKNIEVFQQEKLRIENEKLVIEQQNLAAKEKSNELARQKLEAQELARKQKEELRKEEIRAATERLALEVSLKNQDSAEWVRNSILEEEKEKNRAIEAAEQLATDRLNAIAKRKEAEAKEKEAEISYMETANEKASIDVSAQMARNEEAAIESRDKIFQGLSQVEITQTTTNQGDVTPYIMEINRLKSLLQEASMNEQNLQKQIEMMAFDLENARNQQGGDIPDYQVNHLRQQVDATNQSLTSTQYDVNSLKRNLDEKDRIIKNLQIELQNASNKQVSSAQIMDSEEYRNMKRRLTTTQEDSDRMQRKISELNSEIDLKNKRITELQNMSGPANIIVEETDEYRALQRKYRDNQEELERRESKIRTLQKDLEENGSDAKVKQIREQYNKMEQEYMYSKDTYDRQRKNYENNIADLQNQIQNSKTNYERTIADLEAQIKQLKSLPLLDDEEKNRIEKELKDAINVERKKAQQTIDEANDKIAVYSRYPEKLRQMQGALQNYQGQYQKLVYERQTMLARYRALANELQKAKSEPKANPAELQTLKEQNDTLRGKLQALQGEFSELQAEQENFRLNGVDLNTVKRLKRQIKDLQDEREEYEDNEDQRSSKNSKEFKKLQTDYRNLQDEHEEVTEERDELKKKISELERKFKDFENENNNELNAQLKRLQDQQEAFRREQAEAEQARIADQQAYYEEQRRIAAEEQENRRKELEEQQRQLEDERNRALEQQRLLQEERQRVYEEQQRKAEEDLKRREKERLEAEEELRRKEKERLAAEEEYKKASEKRLKELEEQQRKLEDEKKKHAEKIEKEKADLAAQRDAVAKDKDKFEAEKEADELAKKKAEEDARKAEEDEAAALEAIANAEEEELVDIAKKMGFNVRSAPLNKNPHNVFYITQRKEDGLWQIKPPKVDKPIATFKKRTEAIISGAITSIVWGGKCYAQNEKRKFVAFSSIRDLLEKKQSGQM